MWLDVQKLRKHSHFYANLHLNTFSDLPTEILTDEVTHPPVAASLRFALNIITLDKTGSGNASLGQSQMRHLTQTFFSDYSTLSFLSASLSKILSV